MTSFWWLKLPRVLGRISQWWALVLTDGYFLLTLSFRRFEWLSSALLTIGFLCGLFRPGYEFTPVEAPVLFCSFLFFSMLSGHLGLLLLLGFAVGDLFTTKALFIEQANNYKIELLLAKLHEYVIFGIGMIQIPLFAKQLLGLLMTSLLPKLGQNLVNKVKRSLFFSLMAFLNLLLVGYLTFLWTQAMVLLLRTIYTHIGMLTQDNISLFQYRWQFLVSTALAATGLRIVGQWLSLFIPSVTSQAEQFEQQARSFVYQPGLFDRLPTWVGALWNSLFLTFLMWSAFVDQKDVILFFVSAAFLYTLRVYISALPIWPTWLLKAWHIPVVWRIGLAALVAYALIQVVMPLLYQPTSSFWMVLIPALLSLLIFTIMLPISSTKPDETS